MKKKLTYLAMLSLLHLSKKNRGVKNDNIGKTVCNNENSSDTKENLTLAEKKVFSSWLFKKIVSMLV